MAERLVITATGVITALGYGREENLNALLNKRSGVKLSQHLHTRYSNEYIMGEVDMSNDDLAKLLSLPTGSNGYTRTTLLALAAVKDLLNNTNPEILTDNSFAFINANTVGGMSSVEDMYLDFTSDKKEGDFVKYIDTLDCAESTINVCKYFNLSPITATISTACSSAANAIILGARMIQNGLVERAICGGCDALSRFTFNGFHSLKNIDKEPMRPFSNDRFGLNLGEGAAYMLIEKESDANARGAEILAVLSGYSNTNEAHHPTAPSPEGDGAYRTMHQALAKAGLEPADIDYINAHGTATLNNDGAEGTAMKRLFAEGVPPFSSTKPYTGHTLAAAGGVEGIYSIFALQEQKVLPNLNFTTPMEEVALTPATEVADAEINHVLSSSFGFGGSNVSLIFSKP